MHLLIPHASASSPPAQEVLRDLNLPKLAKLIQRLAPQQPIEGDEYSLSPPHERVLAQAWGWSGADGALPFAAQAARADGMTVDAQAWGLITPVHWHVGRDHITLTDPSLLQLGEAESRAVFEAVRGLFESDGFGLVWAAPTRWYLVHEDLADLPCASLDRVLGRNVDWWLQPPADASPAARRTISHIRRLQNEFQMLLYPHALTTARDARGEPAINSFWLSGCGRAQNADPSMVRLEERLRAPLLANDLAAWAETWIRIDTDTVAALLEHSQQGHPVTLTLCGERHAQTFGQPLCSASLIQRLKKRWATPNTGAILEAL